MGGADRESRVSVRMRAEGKSGLPPSPSQSLTCVSQAASPHDAPVAPPPGPSVSNACDEQQEDGDDEVGEAGGDDGGHGVGGGA